VNRLAACLGIGAMQLWVVNVSRSQACNFLRVIPEIDIRRGANLMLKRYGEKALEESSSRADELAADGDHAGAITWRRITNAVGQLANQHGTTWTAALIGTDPKRSRQPFLLSSAFILDNRFSQECRARRQPQFPRILRMITSFLFTIEPQPV
jgi:hypothetical protein